MQQVQQTIGTNRWTGLVRAAGLVAAGWLVAVLMLADAPPPEPASARAAPAAQQGLLDWRGNSAGPRRQTD